MRYFCLGYIEEKKWDTMSESERNAMLDLNVADDRCISRVQESRGRRRRTTGAALPCMTSKRHAISGLKPLLMNSRRPFGAYGGFKKDCGIPGTTRLHDWNRSPDLR